MVPSFDCTLEKGDGLVDDPTGWCAFRTKVALLFKRRSQQTIQLRKSPGRQVQVVTGYCHSPEAKCSGNTVSR